MYYKKIILLGIVLLPFSLRSSMPNQLDDWGFYAHKLINRMAIFTLPGDLIEFYKSNVDYIVNHAIDPDKRRYAIKGEAVRHYIDLDHWIQDSVTSVPKDYAMALIKYSHFYFIREGKKMLLFDTLVKSEINKDSLYFTKAIHETVSGLNRGIEQKEIKRVITKIALPLYDEEEWIIPADSFYNFLPFIIEDDRIEIDDRFSSHGILPFHLEKIYFALIDAFKSKSIDRILRLSADIGHYVGDAHVPLHTTKNYNGQLTNQDGIHAFWESRIPELFAENEFDFIVGPANYIPNIRAFIWNVIDESHQGVSLVLAMEKLISQQTVPDQQYCYDERLGVISKIQCREYSKKYHQLLDFQVEDRMRSCILNLGSIWMSAWVEAGQPNLDFHNGMNQNEEDIKGDSIPGNRYFNIREHE